MAPDLRREVFRAAHAYHGAIARYVHALRLRCLKVLLDNDSRQSMALKRAG